MKNIFIKFITILILFAAVLTAAGCSAEKTAEENGMLTVTCTIFPQYDIARRIGGDRINLNLLLKMGADSHNYEQTSADIITVEHSDIFITVGGVNDIWTEKVLPSVSDKSIKIIKLMDCVQAVEEETVEGMQDNDNENADEIEYDEHVWTNPFNMIKIAEEICAAFIELDKANDEYYAENLNSLTEDLRELDREIKEVTDGAVRKTLVFGDRFAFRYFTEEYGLDYYAAFSGCSSDTDASAKTLAFLIEKVESENIPAVYYLENGTKKIADAICRETGAEALLLNSCHTVTAEEFNSGSGYIELMRANLENLKKGLY